MSVETEIPIERVTYIDDHTIHSKKSAKTIQESVKHFTEDEAQKLVYGMWHMSNGIRYIGEYFDLSITKKIYEEHKAELPTYVNCIDLYVAINAQYHDYNELFKKWFIEAYNDKLIASAIDFWFDDDDYPDHNKLWDYFNE